ncbi:unnamed protein product, partial [Durusdinium trenchii]
MAGLLSLFENDSDDFNHSEQGPEHTAAAESILQAALSGFDLDLGSEKDKDNSDKEQPGRQQRRRAERSRSPVVTHTLQKNRAVRWKTPNNQADGDGVHAEPNDLPEDRVKDVQEIASALFTGPSLEGQLFRVSRLMNVNRKMIKRHVNRLAAAALEAQTHYSAIFLSKLAKLSGIRQYDETPMWMKATALEQEFNRQSVAQHHGKASSFEVGAATVKLFVVQQRWAAVVGVEGNKGAPSLCFEAQVATPLQILENNSGKVIAEAVRQSVDMGYDNVVKDTFPRVLDIVTTDDYSANHVAERLLTQHYETQFSSCHIGKLH